MVLVTAARAVAAVFAAAPVPWLATIVDQTFGGSSLPYSDAGTTNSPVPAGSPAAPPMTCGNVSEFRPGISLRVTVAGLSTVTLARLVTSPAAIQIAAESFTSVAVTG